MAILLQWYSQLQKIITNVSTMHEPLLSVNDNFYYALFQNLTVRDMLCFGYQVSCGMHYLSGEMNTGLPPLVHRDLAARNIM